MTTNVVQIFPENADVTPSKRIKFGIDPTFPRLHLGHFVPLRLVRQLQAQGHHATIVLGTFTAQLGDPSGRDTTRPILSAEEVQANAQAIAVQVKKILHDFVFFENHTLHNEMKLPEFLRIASNFTLTHMTGRNVFANRIANNHPIALHELLVPICQGMDSVHLHSEIEIGGQDQLFNFQVARQLQEVHGQKPQACMMLPIINGTDGRKMSKSLGNCIFLDEDPNDIFGKVMSIPDSVMIEWWPLLCDEELADHPMTSKKRLARNIVEQLHDATVARKAANHFATVIQNRGLPDEVQSIAAGSLVDIVINLRQCSRTEARRLLNEGAVRIDGEKQSADCQVAAGRLVKIGNRHFARTV